MNWNNLKTNKCPQCNRSLMADLTIESVKGGMDKMLKHKCGFMIRESKMMEIVASKVNKEIDYELEDGFGDGI